MRNQPKVSECANPKCKAEFRKLGEGKLFLQPPHTPGVSKNKRQIAAWLCEQCSKSFTMRFDEEHTAFVLLSHGEAAA